MINCDNCLNCDNCNNCNNCNNCDNCNNCNNCNNCDDCKNCSYCSNLKMSEYQLFCSAEELGRKFPNSYQQKPFRVFNKQITEEEFIKIPSIKLEFDSTESYSTSYKTAWAKAWPKLSEEEKKRFFDLPHFNAEIFKEITGIDVETTSIAEEETINIDGVEYTLSEIKKALKK